MFQISIHLFYKSFTSTKITQLDDDFYLLDTTIDTNIPILDSLYPYVNSTNKPNCSFIVPNNLLYPIGSTVSIKGYDGSWIVLFGYLSVDINNINFVMYCLLKDNSVVFISSDLIGG